MHSDESDTGLDVTILVLTLASLVSDVIYDSPGFVHDVITEDQQSLLLVVAQAAEVPPGDEAGLHQEVAAMLQARQLLVQDAASPLGHVHSIGTAAVKVGRRAGRVLQQLAQDGLVLEQQRHVVGARQAYRRHVAEQPVANPAAHDGAQVHILGASGLRGRRVGLDRVWLLNDVGEAGDSTLRLYTVVEGGVQGRLGRCTVRGQPWGHAEPVGGQQQQQDENAQANQGEGAKRLCTVGIILSSVTFMSLS